MRKILFLMMVLPLSLFAQEDSLKPKVKKNEIIVNAFELIVGGVVPISYERFIDNSQSIMIKTFFFDKNYSNFNSGYGNLFSLQAQYNYYLSEKKKNAGFFLASFVKFTAGKYIFVGFPPTKKYGVKVSSAGFGVGYKFLLKNKLSFSITTDIGRVLSKYAYYTYELPIDPRAGINMGLRF